MNRLDFSVIKHFPPDDVVATGAKLADVQLETMIALDKLRDSIGVAIILIKDGMTTGIHKAVEHPKGKAVDFTTGKVVPLPKIHAAAILAGFRGFGVYWNGKVWSYHVDLRPEYCAPWIGRKAKPGASGWAYKQLYVDPKGI